MKVELYEPKQSPENVVRLRLIDECGVIKLVAVDAAGDTIPGGYLLGFEMGSTRGFYLCSSIDLALGFPLSDDGSLKMTTW